MVFNERQKAVLEIFELSEMWHRMGYESADEALEDGVSYEEIEALMEQESHNLEEEIREILNEK